MLAFVELLSWGVLYYSFPVAVPHISAETGWSTTTLAVVYSVCLVSAALAGLFLGRVIDHDGRLRRIMPWCSLAGCAGLLLSVTGRFELFVLGWVLVGIAQAGTLWTPAFIAITRWYDGQDGTWPMTVITAVGGSASLVFAPLVAHMSAAKGWEWTFVALALGYGLITIPAQVLGLRAKWEVTAQERATSRVELRETTRQGRFVILQLCMFICGVALFGVTLNLVSLAQEKGATYTQAAFIFGLVGLGQVVGRIGFTMLPGQARPGLTTAGLMWAAAIVLAVLAFTPPVAALACLAVAAGAVRGSHTLLMRGGVLDRWGPQNFGAVMAWFNLPVALGIAVSPAIGAGLASALGGYTAATIALAAAVLVGSLAALRT